MVGHSWLNSPLRGRQPEGRRYVNSGKGEKQVPRFALLRRAGSG